MILNRRAIRYNLFLLFLLTLSQLNILSFIKRHSKSYLFESAPQRRRVNAYILSYNRLTVLKKTVQSLLQLVPPQNIIIIDNGSDYGPLLTYLNLLVKNGSTLYRCPKLENANDLDRVSLIIEKHKRIQPCDFYIVTDPDVEMSNISANFIDVAGEFLKRFNNITTVGPMLRIDDIPEEYGPRQLIWDTNGVFFYGKYPLKLTINKTEVFYQFTYIDTTLGVLQGNTVFRRMMNGVRLYHPFDARHLDWYVTPMNMQDDQRSFINSSNKAISHWGVSDFADLRKNRTKNYLRSIYIVKDNGSSDNHTVVQFNLTSTL